MTLVVCKLDEEYEDEPSLDIFLINNKEQHNYMDFKYSPLIVKG